jgi:Notch-like protein
MQSLISNSNNKRKTIWNIIKTVKGRKLNDAGIQALNIVGKLMDHYTITESLNNYFLTIADKINTNNTKFDHIIHDDSNKYMNYLSQAFKTPFPKINLNYTSTKETENIKSFKSNNSNGYDEISVKILKISAPFISSPLTYICNRVLPTGVFPSWLKYSEIITLFKNCDRTNMTNYRPISFLSSFSKVLEKVACIRMNQHITTNNQGFFSAGTRWDGVPEPI